jgi:uncharacterized membrane protein
VNQGRLEAFSDGVLAIIITIMVLELKPPHHPGFSDLFRLYPVFLSYVLSFIYVGIYWNNHHHLFKMAEKVNGKVLWANLHLLFWLSLIPFVTAWSGENHFGPLPVASYGFVLMMCGVAYYIMTKVLLQLHGERSPLANTLGTTLKEKLSVIFYLTAIPLAFLWPLASLAIYVMVASMWLVPDQRLEKALME